MSSHNPLEQTINIEQFDGPFHVLVEMLESQELDITEVALSKVTQQYVQTINQQENIDPYSVADFLVIASKLIYIKSKTLLPMLSWNDDEEVDVAQLENQLKMYKKYFEASKTIQSMLASGNTGFARSKMIVELEYIFNPPHDLTVTKLEVVYQKIIDELEPIVKIPKQVIKNTISLREKINHVRERILEKINANFSELMSGVANKTEAVVTFLAILELVKQQTISVDQQELHGEIFIQKKDTK